ncbi:hypothetical protein [Sphingomonas lenta]|uniref:Uncharacterized protein n=1 Tax=Sphingomonas lenta TaxID=1141887 RepID=A0A2A2SAK3_9SPHN|nr:hypothetical protein [Sphingomonas lenta]PAX06334.1 hypothetical protein CKY28_17795 [Sphingomonas lenta]
MTRIAGGSATAWPASNLGRRHAHRIVVGGYILQDHGVSAHHGTVAGREVTDELGAREHANCIAEPGIAALLPITDARAAQRDLGV